MRGKTLTLLAMTVLAGIPLQAQAGIILGTAGDFAVLANTMVSNAGPSVIDGNVGGNAGAPIMGFPPGIVVPPSSIHAGDSVAIQAMNDLAIAYNAATILAPTHDLTGQDLGGLTLLPGVYFFTSTAQLTGNLILDNAGDPNAQFVFQIGSTLTTAANSTVVTINGGSSHGNTVFWQVGSSATFGAATAFEGHILAFASITMGAGMSILDGSALALNGAVTLDSNTITNSISAVPEPAAMTLTFLGSVLLGLPGIKKRLRERLSRSRSVRVPMVTI